jgi:hypothetical protein
MMLENRLKMSNPLPFCLEKSLPEAARIPQ